MCECECSVFLLPMLSTQLPSSLCYECALTDGARSSVPQGSYVVHIFPPCDFANENMARIAPDLLSAVAEVPHLVIVIATC